jgi:hypothetical protein
MGSEKRQARDRRQREAWIERRRNHSLTVLLPK